MRRRPISGLALVFALLPVIPMPQLLAQNKDGSAEHADKADKQNPLPQQTVTVNCVDRTESNSKGRQKDYPAADNKPDYAAWGFWFNVILTPITLLVAGAAVWQAIAANSSAKAVMYSERAWLLLEGEKIGAPFLIPTELQQHPQKTPTYCEVALRNCGNTPATAIDWQFELQIGDSTEFPPSFEIYKRGPQKDRLTPFPIGQDRLGNAFAKLTPQEHISTSEKTGIDDGSKTLWLCGIVRYHDVFEQKRIFRRQREQHQTLVCLRYLATPRLSGRWVLGGPSGHNKAT